MFLAVAGDVEALVLLVRLTNLNLALTKVAANVHGLALLVELVELSLVSTILHEGGR
jgi:hypothetical protein